MAKFILLLGGMHVDKRLAGPNVAPAIVKRCTAWIEGVRKRALEEVSTRAF